MPTFWIALVALYVGFYRLGWFPGADRLDPGTLPPPHVTGLYTIDALLAGDWGLFAAGAAPSRAAGARARGVQRQPADALHALGRARGDRQRLRPRGAREGPARTTSSSAATSCAAALPSVVTVLGLVFANVLTGAVLVEKIFSWPGIGQYAYQAAVNLDVPAIAGVSIFVAIVYVTVNFIVDVLYGVIDPRIRIT